MRVRQISEYQREEQERESASFPGTHGEALPFMHGNIRLNFRPTRKELAMANTMVMPKKGASEDMLPPSNHKEWLERYRMQVDRQTKSSYAKKEDAEKAGSAIKKAHPKLQVTIYDSEKSETTVL
jgi:hypothetical protein